MVLDEKQLLQFFEAEFSQEQEADEIKKNVSEELKAFAENIEADVKSVKSAYALFKKYRSGKNTQMACEDYLQLSNVVDSYFCSNIEQ